MSVFLLVLLVQTYTSPQTNEINSLLNKSQIYLDSVRVLLKEDTSFSSLQTLGKVYLLEGEFFRAENSLMKALKKNPEDTLTLRLLALTYYRTGRTTRALELFGKLSESPEILYCIGKIYAQKNCWDEALNNFKECWKGVGKGKDTLWANLAQQEIERITEGKSLELKDLELDVQQIVKSAPTKEEYPEAGAIILLKESFFNLENNAFSSTSRQIIKILNDRGKREFGEVKIGYDDTYEYVNIDYVRVIKPTREVITVPDKHIKTTTPYSNFPLYSNYKIKVISIPELEVGSIIEYKIIKRKIKLINDNNFYEKIRIKTNEPILQQKYELTVPERRRVWVKSLGRDVKPEKKKAGNYIVYSWEISNMKSILPERNMPSWDEVVPQIWISSFENWEEIYNWWKSLYEDKIGVDEKMREKVKELTRDLPDEEKIRRIYEWVSSDVRYVGLEYGEGGVEPHRATEVFKNRYGDCKDKAILLVSMLREVGIKAYPVLIGVNRRKLEKTFPMPQFNHAIVMVENKNSSFIFLDPTPETCPYNYLPSNDQGRLCMVFFEEECAFKETPLFIPEINKETRKMQIRIAANGSIEADKVGEAWGEKAMMWRTWFKHSKPTRRREVLENEVSHFCSNGELLDYSFRYMDSLNYPFVIKEKFRVPDYLKEIGDGELSFELPTVVFHIMGVGKKERRFPIDYRYPELKRYNVEVELPESLSVKFLPEDLSVRNRYGSFSYDIESKGKKIFINISYVRIAPRIPVEGYKEWKTFAAEIKKKIEEEIIFKKD